MPIRLRITSYQRLTPGQQDLYQPEIDAFTIGRGKNNHVVLPDPQLVLSGSHCRIERRGKRYYITDLSTNGVFVNGAKKRLGKGRSTRLADGDRFRIGDYEFAVQVGDLPEGGQSNPFRREGRPESVRDGPGLDDEVTPPERPAPLAGSVSSLQASAGQGGPGAQGNAAGDDLREEGATAARQNAVEEVLRLLNPSRLKAGARKPSFLGRLIPGIREAKAWEAFERQYASLLEALEDRSGAASRRDRKPGAG